MRKISLSVLIMLAVARVSSAAQDYSKMSIDELNEALVMAVKKGSADQVQKLVKAGANVNQNITYIESGYDYDFDCTRTVLEYAAKHGCVDIVKEVMQGKVNNDTVDQALILAAEEGHADVVRELIKAGANINCVNNMSYTALIKAARKGYTNVVKELVGAGANLNHTDKWGNTALIEAARNDYANVVKELIRAGANVNHANKTGHTALIEAIEKHAFDVVQILLKVPKINLNHANNDGNTALIRALQCLQLSYVTGNKEQYNNCLNSQNILETLLQTPGIDFHYANKKGDTPIKLLKKLEMMSGY